MKNLKHNNKNWHSIETWNELGQKEFFRFDLLGKLKRPSIISSERIINYSKKVAFRLEKAEWGIVIHFFYFFLCSRLEQALWTPKQ